MSLQGWSLAFLHPSRGKRPPETEILVLPHYYSIYLLIQKTTLLHEWKSVV